MRHTHKLFLIFAVLALSVLATLLVVSAANFDRTTQATEPQQETISYELLYFYAPPATPPDLLPDCEPREPGFDPDWRDSYEGPQENALLYAYGFADQYGRMNFELPGYGVEEQIEIADAYVKYASCLYDDNPEEAMGFTEFVQAYVDSGESRIYDFLRCLTFEPEDGN